VITGAAGGIGAVSCELFEREGATVVGVDVKSVPHVAIEADVTDEDQVRDMYARAREEHGAHRRVVQQRGDLAERRRVRSRHLARGLAAGAGREPEVGFSLLPARDSTPA
jgi:NAD(P)-dependent dehydrogenase (short-subunit alcohol dehydrogenase family)